jgi:hypothetical protein
MFDPKTESHKINGVCFCSKCRAYRQTRYDNDPAVKELSDKLRAARTKQLGAFTPQTRLDECIRVVLTQIDKK